MKVGDRLKRVHPLTKQSQTAEVVIVSPSSITYNVYVGDRFSHQDTFSEEQIQDIGWTTE